jgi:hypothetical protein
MQVNPWLDFGLWTLRFFAYIMRHFAAPEAGNWVVFDRIQVLSSSQIKLGSLPLFFYLWFIIHP